MSLRPMTLLVLNVIRLAAVLVALALTYLFGAAVATHVGFPHFLLLFVLTIVSQIKLDPKEK